MVADYQLAWTSNVTLRGSWITPETGIQNRRVDSPLTSVISHKDTQSNSIADLTAVTVWTFFVVCHCTFMISLFPMESLDLAAGTCFYPCGWKTVAQSNYQQAMGDFWDAWWQQTYQAKYIVLGCLRVLRITSTMESLLTPSASNTGTIYQSFRAMQ